MSTFRITGLDPANFSNLFGKSDEGRAARGAVSSMRHRDIPIASSCAVEFIDVHNAKPGCFAARVRRV